MSPTTYDSRAAGRARHQVTPGPGEFRASGGIGAPAILVFLFILMIIVDQTRGVAAGTAAGVGVPESVVGTWIAKDPRYAARSIQIDPALVVIKRGEGEAAAIGVVEDVDTWREGAQDVVRVTYHSDDGDYSIDLLPQDRGGLRLRNPNEVLWVRR